MLRRRRAGRHAAFGPPACAASLALLGATLHAAGAAPPDAADLARCAAIVAAAPRLACYDALANASAAAPLPAAPPAAAATSSAPAPVAAPPGATPPGAAQASAPAPAPRAPAPPAGATEIQNFGLSAAQQHLTDLGPRAMQARVASVSRNEPGHALITLDNDQTWVVNEDDGRLSAGDRVTIKRAAMGSYLLLSQANHTYHVRRVR